MRFIIFFIFIFIINLKAHSQNGSFQSGAKSASLAHASVTIRDAYSMFNNISGISSEETPVAVATYATQSGLKAFSNVTAGFVIPSGWGNTSIGLYRFGDHLYNEQKLGIGYGHKLGMVSLGAQVNYLQYSIEGYGSTGTLLFDIGGIANLIPELTFGAFISNFNQAKISRLDNERVATIMRAGLSYKPIKELSLITEAEKDIDYKPDFKLGLEYEIASGFFLRSGFSTTHKKGSYGLGLKPGRLQVDYAMASSRMLGYNHQVSLAYLLKKNIN